MSARRRVAGAAVKAVAPEAAVAAKAAGKATGSDPRKTAPGSKAAQQRQQIEDVKARRKPEPVDEHQDDEHQDDDAGGRFAPLAGMRGPATGGGFVLGLMVWAVVRAYIGVSDDQGHVLASGPAGVKALLSAKFLNKPLTGGATK